MAILVRPVREQLEHDRLTRHLQQQYAKRHEVAMNVGDEQLAPVKIAGLTLFPDLVLSADRKLSGVVEVETGESVHNLEAMYQWVPFSKVRVPFYLYVPVPSYDAARRLCEAHGAKVTEIWTYRPAMEGFDLVRMFQDPAQAGAAARFGQTLGKPKVIAKPAPPDKPAPIAKPVPAPRPGPPAKPAPAAKAKPVARPAAKPSPKAAAKKPVKPARPAARKPAAKPVRPAARAKAAPKRGNGGRPAKKKR